MRIGIGYDIHRFGEDRELVIGGIRIPYDLGLLGHSDADVLVHAIMDALLGACGKQDIGTYFPDNNPKYKDIDSLVLLKEVKDIVCKEGHEISNIDSIIIAELPKIGPYIESMKKKLAEILDIDITRIGIKATTNEKLDAIGNGEGIAAQATALLIKNEK